MCAFLARVANSIEFNRAELTIHPYATFHTLNLFDLAVHGGDSLAPAPLHPHALACISQIFRGPYSPNALLNILVRPSNGRRSARFFHFRPDLPPLPANLRPANFVVRARRNP